MCEPNNDTESLDGLRSNMTLDVLWDNVRQGNTPALLSVRACVRGRVREGSICS